MSWPFIPPRVSTILLMLPPWEPRTPPLALASLVEYLRFRGHEIAALDLNGHLHREAEPEERYLWLPGPTEDELTRAFTTGRLGRSTEALIEAICASELRVVGLSLNSHSLGVALHINRALRRKRPDLVLLGGGPGVLSPHARADLAASGLDYVIVGEGEETLCEVLTALRDHPSLPPMAGVIPAPHRPGFAFQPRPLLDLAQVPLPTYSDFSLDTYVPPPWGRTLILQTSRGCDLHCAFCPDPAVQGPLRTYPPRAVEDHIARLVQLHAVQHLEFADLILNGRPLELRTWCEGVARRRLPVLWSGQCTFVEGMSIDVLRAMRRAGCISLRFGLESGSDAVLRAMGKPYTAALASRILGHCHEVGLTTSLCLMVGFPGETVEDLEQTLAFVRHNAVAINEVQLISTCELRVGGRLFQQPEAFGILPGLDDQVMAYRDRCGNTAEVRDHRAQQLLRAVCEEGIPVQSVVDGASRAGRPNRLLEQCRAELTQAWRTRYSLESDELRLSMEPQTRDIALSVRGLPLTEAPGFGAVVTLDGRAVDMTCGRWRCWRDDKSVIHLESTLLFVPGRLLVHVSTLDEQGLALQLDLWLEQEARLELLRVGLWLGPHLQVLLGPQGWQPLASVGEGDQILLPPPVERLVVSERAAEEQSGLLPPMLILHVLDRLYWKALLVKDARGRRLMLERLLDPQVGGRTLPAGLHRLLQARLDAPVQAPLPSWARSGRSPRSSSGLDAALVHCPPGSLDAPPIPLGQLTAALRAQDFRCRAHDLNARLYALLAPADRWPLSDEMRASWSDEMTLESLWPLLREPLTRLLDDILAERPTVVALFSDETGIRCALKLASLLRQMGPGVYIVLGGPGVFWTLEQDGVVRPRGLLDPGTSQPLPDAADVDMFLRGEAELTLPLLIHHLVHGLDPLDVPGAIRLDGDGWRTGAPPTPPALLDDLPLPDYSDLDWSLYRRRMARLVASRGCPRVCVSCNDCRLSSPYRLRRARVVLEEINILRQQHPELELLEFDDLAMGGDLEQLEALCDGLLDDLRAPLPWRARLLVRPDLPDVLFPRLARAGCRELSLHLHSLSPRVLEAMRKDFSLSQIRDILGRIRAAGIDTAVTLMVGFPRETPELFRETLTALRELHDRISRVEAVELCEIAFGSRLWETPHLFGIDTRSPEFWRLWTGPFGNTYAERLARQKELRRVAVELGLMPAQGH